jgi:hypothetical protein
MDAILAGLMLATAAQENATVFMIRIMKHKRRT